MDACAAELNARPPDPFALSLQEWLRTDGGNRMLAMLRVIAGSANSPAIARDDGTNPPRDGIFFPSEEQLAIALGGALRHLFESDGFSFYVSRWLGKITHANTANRVWTFPDLTGTVFAGTFSLSNPTPSDDGPAGFPVGSLWVNINTGTLWVSVDDTDDAAEWVAASGGFGTSDTGDNMTVSVGTSAVKVLDSMPARLGGLLTNNGSADAYLGFSSTVVAGDVADAEGGWIIKRGGSSFSLSQVAGYTGELWAITKLGSTVMAAAQW